MFSPVFILLNFSLRWVFFLELLSYWLQHLWTQVFASARYTHYSVDLRQILWELVPIIAIWLLLRPLWAPSLSCHVISKGFPFKFLSQIFRKLAYLNQFWANSNRLSKSGSLLVSLCIFVRIDFQVCFWAFQAPSLIILPFCLAGWFYHSFLLISNCVHQSLTIWPWAIPKPSN